MVIIHKDRASLCKMYKDAQKKEPMYGVDIIVFFLCVSVRVISQFHWASISRLCIWRARDIYHFKACD